MITAIFAFCASCSSAQPKLENSLLWKISGNGLTEESYLFGTNHGVHYSFLDSVNGFWNAYNSAKNIVVEMDLSTVVPTAPKDDIIFMPKDSSYKALFTEEEYAFIDNYLNLNGFGHLSDVNVKPALLTIVLSSIITNKAINNLPNNQTIDFYITQKARKVQKSILQLDSLENYHEQRYRAYGITAPLDKQASNLYNLIKNEDVIKSTTVQIINLYKNQQISEFIKLEELFKTINKDFVQDIGTERNQLWMKKITKIIHYSSSFIAVGLMHLVGEEGLINLLRKAGYTVEPVISNNEEGTYQIEDLLADAEEITFELHKNLLYIDATIADSVKSKFIFDTGALYLVLDSTLYANNFGRVDTLMKAVTSGVGENREYAHLSKGIWSYQLGNVKHREKNAAVMNLKKIIGNNDVGGIVGAIFMRNRNIVVDYQNSKIYLLKPESQSKKIGNSAKGYYKNRSFTPYITLDLYINDSIKISGDFLLDIGSSYTISLTSKTAKDYNLESVITHLEEDENYSVGGKYKYRTFMADSASIAGYTIRNIEADYSLSEAGALSNTPYLGLVGNGFLKNFMLQIDFESGRVWLRPYDHKE